MNSNLEALHAAFAGPNGGASVPPHSLSLAFFRLLAGGLRTVWLAYIRIFEGAGSPPTP